MTNLLTPQKTRSEHSSKRKFFLLLFETLLIPMFTQLKFALSIDNSVSYQFRLVEFFSKF